MTSTFPTSKSSSQNLKNGLREIQHKKETLLTLEIALKKRINEFRELCLKEGELTGHLPVDYPLQPREPIPQVRRRMTRSNGNIPNELILTNSILQTALRSQSSRLTPSSTSSTLSADDQPIRRRLESVEEPPVVVQGEVAPAEDPAKSINLNGVTKLQTYYEETKPFQMSDFYKYSSKLRQQTNGYNYEDNGSAMTPIKDYSNQQPPPRPPRLNVRSISDRQQKPTIDQLKQPENKLNYLLKNYQLTTSYDTIDVPKTTRQLQEDVARNQSHIRMASCDDQILASRKLIERSGQKLIEATAKAIAVNPGLAGRLNNLLPQHKSSIERF